MTDSDPQKHLAAALGRVPSGLFILTARQRDAETGMLASWVQQCSFDPPQISVAIKKNRQVLAWLTEGAPFTINILDDCQSDMIAHFGKGFALGDAAFTGLEMERFDDAAPILSEALGYLQCRVTGQFSAGDHDILIGRVEAGRLLGEGHPMVHIRKSGSHY